MNSRTDAGWTAGEWRVEADMRPDTHKRPFDGSEYLAGWNVLSDAGEIVGCEGIIPGDNAEANAHLIAASPTLAEYVRRKADEGCAEATSIMESIYASR